MSVYDLVFHYDPDPDPDQDPAGVTPGWLVLWDGAPGPALITKGALLRDDEGVTVTVFEGPLEPCTVVDGESPHREGE